MRSASSVIGPIFWYFAGKFAMPLIAFLTGWVAIYFRRWQKRRREDSAQAWPSVQGVIVSARVHPLPETKHFHAIVQYAFFVDEYRTGKYIHEFSNEDEADDFVRQLRDKIGRAHV